MDCKLIQQYIMVIIYKFPVERQTKEDMYEKDNINYFIGNDDFIIICRGICFCSNN